MKARVNGSTFHSSRSSAFSFLLFIPRAWICSSHFALQIFPCARLIAKPVFNLQGGKINWLTSLLQKKPQMITLSPPCWRGDVTLAFFFNFFLFFWPNFALCLPDWLTKWTFDIFFFPKAKSSKLQIIKHPTIRLWFCLWSLNETKRSLNVYSDQILLTVSRSGTVPSDMQNPPAFVWKSDLPPRIINALLYGSQPQTDLTYLL